MASVAVAGSRRRTTAARTGDDTRAAKRPGRRSAISIGTPCRWAGVERAGTFAFCRALESHDRTQSYEEQRPLAYQLAAHRPRRRGLCRPGGRRRIHRPVARLHRHLARTGPRRCHVRQLQARTAQASEQLVEKTKGLEATQQASIDQLQVVQDQLQTVRRLLAAQQNRDQAAVRAGRQPDRCDRRPPPVLRERPGLRACTPPSVRKSRAKKKRSAVRAAQARQTRRKPLGEPVAAPSARGSPPVDRGPKIHACQYFFSPIVNWITYARNIPGHHAVHRMAQANFNIRGWQGRWRYTASTALFFPSPPRSIVPDRSRGSLAASPTATALAARFICSNSQNIHTKAAPSRRRHPAAARSKQEL